MNAVKPMPQTGQNKPSPDLIVPFQKLAMVANGHRQCGMLQIDAATTEEVATARTCKVALLSTASLNHLQGG